MKKFIHKIGRQLSLLGKAMLIPIVSMPLAALLFRLGQSDLLNQEVLTIAGEIIIGNMDLLFAIGAVTAYAKTKDKSTAVLAAVLSMMVFKRALEFVNPEVNMGVFAGIVVGSITAWIFNHTKEWKVPNMFSFFAGENLSVTLAPVFMVGLAYVFNIVWPPLQNMLDGFALFLGATGALGVFLFGFLNRLLIPVGLHHVLNSYIYFELGEFVSKNGEVITGEMTRFLAGDQTAGAFMVMFFVIMIFGIPGAALAIYKTSKEENKPRVKSLMSSGALTSLLVGTTEPIEFSFLFVAPKLYFIHAVYTGLAGVVLYMLGSRLGFAFGFNIIDLTLNWNMGVNVFMIIPVGIAFFFLYYFTFKYVIKKYNLATPGREEAIMEDEVSDSEINSKLGHSNYAYMAKKIIQNIGGKENIVTVTNCVTRLRLELKDASLMDVEKIKQTGAKGVIKLSDTSVQIIIGSEVTKVAEHFRELAQV